MIKLLCCIEDKLALLQFLYQALKLIFTGPLQRAWLVGLSSELKSSQVVTFLTVSCQSLIHLSQGPAAAAGLYPQGQSQGRFRAARDGLEGDGGQRDAGDGNQGAGGGGAGQGGA